LPAPSRVSAGLIVGLVGFPEALIAKAVPLPLPNDDFIKGKVLWAQSYSTTSGFEAFRIVLCEGRCELPYLQRMRDLKVGAPLVESKTLPLSGSRTLEASLTTGGLGGGVVFSSARSPGGNFDVVVVFGLPPDDIPVSDKVRAFFRESVPLDLALTLGKGLEAALFW
jgi:hypothetical protein